MSVQELIGKRVVSVELDDDASLLIRFENGLELYIDDLCAVEAWKEGKLVRLESVLHPEIQ